MCGRVIVDYDEMIPAASNSELSAWLSSRPTAAESSWNIKPTQLLPVALTSSKTGEKRFELAHWSLVPPWADSLKLKYPTFNARAESVTEKATFKNSVKRQRCVIPVTGFYEWTGDKGSRVPHAIFGATSILPLAGLYSWWRDPSQPEGEGWHLTATILTQASGGVMRALHDRMPVFLDDEIIHDWLNPEVMGDQTLVDAAAALSVPHSQTLREYQVKPLRGDGAELIEPA